MSTTSSKGKQVGKFVQKKTPQNQNPKQANGTTIDNTKPSQDEEDNSCLICCNPIAFHSIGACNHKQLCSVCSLRLRELYKEKECPICKQVLDTVIFTTAKDKNFKDFNLSDLIYDDKFGIYIDSKEHEETIRHLWDIKCTVCNQMFDTLDALKRHTKDVHSLYFCEICLQERKIFLHEQKLYSKKLLQQHMQSGDAESNMKGHPLCEFCQENFFNNDVLYEHLERNHFKCHICDKDGVLYQYFKDYPNLEHHFKSKHFLCMDKTCLEKKFVVFRTLIDLQAHDVQSHLSSRNLSKKEEKKARTVHVNFNYTPHEPIRFRRTDDMQDIISISNTPNVSTISLPSQHTTTSSIPESKQEEEEIPVKPPEPIRTNPEELKKELARRNKELIQKMKDFLNNDVRFKDFRQVSASFLNGKINETQYYDAFLSAFGDVKAEELFPELVALLPDETKQERLQHVRDKRKDKEKDFPRLPAQPKKASKKTEQKKKDTKKDEGFVTSVVCYDCGETVIMDNWDKHTNTHVKQRLQQEEEARLKKLQQEEMEKEHRRRQEELNRKLLEDTRQRMTSTPNNDFPSLPTNRPSSTSARTTATIFNNTKTVAVDEFPALPVQTRKLEFSKEEYDDPYLIQDDSGKKGKKKSSKKGQVVLRWG